MKLNFWKYQGNGNDFVIIEDLENTVNLTVGANTEKYVTGTLALVPMDLCC